MKNNPNGDDWNLSNMIDEYEEDSELRKKIAAMKQQRMPNESAQETSQQDESLPERNQSDDFETERDIDQTQVMERTMMFDRTSAVNEHQDDGDSLYLYDNREVEAEEITEEDIEEFLEDKDKQQFQKREDGSKNMNKAITTVIVGVLAIILVVGTIYGVKALIGGESTSERTDDPKKPDVSEKDPNKDDDKDPDKDDDKDPDKDPSQDPDQNPSVDKNTEIAKIKGKISANTEQIAVYNQKIVEAKKIMEENKIDGDELITKQTEQDNVTRAIGVLEREIDRYQQECATPSEEEPNEFCTDFALAEKQSELDGLRNQLNDLNKQIQVLNDKKNQYNQANTTLNELNNEVTRLNNENTKLNEQLSTLQ